MSDFLFHKVSEKEKEKIKKQAKSIIENFSKKLSQIDGKVSDSGIERKECERVESRSQICDEDFRKGMFENAPEKSEDFIIAEKKEW